MAGAASMRALTNCELFEASMATLPPSRRCPIWSGAEAFGCVACYVGAEASESLDEWCHGTATEAVGAVDSHVGARCAAAIAVTKRRAVSAGADVDVGVATV